MLAGSGLHQQDVKAITLVEIQQCPGALVGVDYEDDAGKLGQEVGPIQSLLRVLLEKLCILVHEDDGWFRCHWRLEELLTAT